MCICLPLDGRVRELVSVGRSVGRSVPMIARCGERSEGHSTSESAAVESSQLKSSRTSHTILFDCR